MPTSSHRLFSNIAHTKIPSFYNDKGETNYKEVVSVFLKLSNDDIAKLANISVKSVRFQVDRMPPVLKERINEIKNICELVFEMMDKDIEKTQLWFTTKNLSLGNISPRDMIRFGRYQKLLDVLMDIKSGNIP